MKIPRPGEKFGDYTIVRRLGKGGMGEVWLLEGKSGGLIAAKILDPSTADDHEARKRFLREAELALGVKHPHLVETYDVGEDPESGLCYILMEYVPGGTLSAYLKANGALTVEDAVSVVAAMAEVLELGRKKGIVHRDIKPSNIMFDAEGTPKLADLGIARARDSGTETTTVTQTGMVIGTPAYMSPEQMFDSHNVDTRADIYSLGIVFFEMLTGVRPNKDDTLVQLMAKAVRGEPIPDVRTLRPEVSAPLAKLLSLMVVPDRDRRISTPGQITRALMIIDHGEDFICSGPSGGLIVSRPKAVVPRRDRRVLWRVLVTVGLLSAVMLTLLKLNSQGESGLSRLLGLFSTLTHPPVTVMTPRVPTNALPESVTPPSVPTNAAPEVSVPPQEPTNTVSEVGSPPSQPTNATPEVALPPSETTHAVPEIAMPPSEPTNAISEVIQPPGPPAGRLPKVIASRQEPTNAAPPSVTPPVRSRPTLTVRASIDGNPAHGAKIIRGVSEAEADLPWRSTPLREGTTVGPFVVECRQGGRKWRGTIPVISVDWHGPKTKTCALAEFYECEFVPYSEGWLGGVRHVRKIDSVEVKGCSTDEVQIRTNRLGGVSAFVTFRGKRLDNCFITIRAEETKGTSFVQLTPRMPARIDVKMSK